MTQKEKISVYYRILTNTWELRAEQDIRLCFEEVNTLIILYKYVTEFDR
jgi:hypothetical protein